MNYCKINICIIQTNLSLLMNFVCAAMGTSVKSNILRKKGFLAAHCTISSLGKRSRLQANATRKISLRRLTHAAWSTTCRKVAGSYLIICSWLFFFLWSYGCCSMRSETWSSDSAPSLSVSYSVGPLWKVSPPVVWTGMKEELLLPEIGVVVCGPKKDEKQQMHIMRASEKRPSLFPSGEALTLRSRTKEISASSSSRTLLFAAQADGGLLSLNSWAVGLLCYVIYSALMTEPEEWLCVCEAGR